MTLQYRCLHEGCVTTYLAMVALETLLTAVVSSISPGTMKSTVVLRSTADPPLELMGLSQPGRPTARATRRRLCFDLEQVLNIVNLTHIHKFFHATLLGTVAPNLTCIAR